MIRFEGAGKHYPGAADPALADFDLAVPEGTTCVLIGPSGCGKSTALRMVNRLVEPDRGRVTLAGQDVRTLDPIGLRRGMGYVLQGVGLFPHVSVARNVGTVPELLGWPRARIAARVEEMLDLVGLDPAVYRDRRPAALSGGQQQRVGVARALAADPPVLLMDEPFGAVDPVARTRLQGEIAAILQRVKKTVIVVTHDIDEAILMGDQVALMRAGRLVQADTPDALLAAPEDAFAAAFLGSDRALRRLAVLRAADFAEAGNVPDGRSIPGDTSLRDALALLVAEDRDRFGLSDGVAGRVLTLDAIRRAGANAKGPPSRTAPSKTTMPSDQRE